MEERMCFVFARREPLRFISHLDMVRLFHRALRRSRLPLAYSKGFSPHPRFNLAAPLPLGATAGEEPGEVYFDKEVSPARFLRELGSQLPPGLELTGAFRFTAPAPSLPALVGAACYRAVPGGRPFPLTIAGLAAAVDRLLKKERIIVERKDKKGRPGQVDIRDQVIDLTLDSDSPPCLQMILKTGSKGGVAPAAVLAVLLEEMAADRTIEDWPWQLHRVNLYRISGEHLLPLITE